MTPLKLTTTVPAPGVADCDWTSEFVASGTTFSIDGPVRASRCRTSRSTHARSVRFEGA